MKGHFILSVFLIFVMPMTKGEITIIDKSQLPTVFRAPSDFDLQSEQWLCKVDNNILLFGGGSRGTLYATYHFLEDILDVHWWTPWGEEFVPSTMTVIPNNMTIAGMPVFQYREAYSGLTDKIERPFYAQNRCNGATTYLGINYGWNETFSRPHIVHTFGSYLPADQYFSEHPEYFALINGVRNNTQLCMSNEAVYNIILTKLTKYIAEDQATALAGGHPMPRYYELSQNDSVDSEHYCQCPACAALIQEQGEAPSAPVIKFINRLAMAIKSKYPDVMLSTLAYQATEKPPGTLQIADNVTIRLAGIYNNFAKKFSHSANADFTTNMQGWNNLAKHVFVWHYITTYGKDSAHNFIALNLASDLRYCRENKVEAIFLEHENSKFPEVFWEFDHWAALKLMENPELSIDVLLNIFCTGYYGTTAGAEIRQYMKQMQIVALANNNDVHWFSNTKSADYSHLDCAFVATAQQHWRAAEANATGVYLQRVKNARLGFDRYVLFAGQRLIDEYVAAGNSIIDFSADVINLYQAAQRSLATLSNLPTDRFPSRYFTTEVKDAEIEVMNRFSTIFQTISASSALPTQISSNMHFVYYPLEVDLYGAGNDHSIVIDSNLSTKAAVLMENWTLNGGVYNQKTKSGSFYFSYPTISETQYQWVKLGTGTISQFDYMWFLDSWSVQIHYGKKVLVNGLTNGTIWGEFRQKSATEQMYLNRIAIVFN